MGRRGVIDLECGFLTGRINQKIRSFGAFLSAVGTYQSMEVRGLAQGILKLRGLRPFEKRDVPVTGLLDTSQEVHPTEDIPHDPTYRNLQLLPPRATYAAAN